MAGNFLLKQFLCENATERNHFPKYITLFFYSIVLWKKKSILNTSRHSFVQLLWSMDFKQLGVVLHYVNCKDRVKGKGLLEILVLSVNGLWL